jgi:hypothetical protein
MTDASFFTIMHRQMEGFSSGICQFQFTKGPLRVQGVKAGCVDKPHLTA